MTTPEPRRGPRSVEADGSLLYVASYLDPDDPPSPTDVVYRRPWSTAAKPARKLGPGVWGDTTGAGRARDAGDVPMTARRTSLAAKALRGADHRCADAARYVLASAPPDRRLRVALAVVEAWRETP